MASPHASSFMCLPFDSKKEVSNAYMTYYGVCLGSGCIGTLGSLLFLYQVLCGAAAKSISKTQKNILVNLAFADFLADIGVIGRSLYYIIYWRNHDLTKTDVLDTLPQAITGAFTESWVVFWYLASYFWTFFFAVDIYTAKHKGRWKLWCSHIVTWLYCSLLAATGTLALWACAPPLECAVDKYCIVGHFLCTFGPILIFLVSLPVFYFSILKKIIDEFKDDGHALEVREREKKQAKKKILLFIIVFYFCWLVNVVDGVILVIYHLVEKGALAPSVRQTFLYKPAYIYTVWIIEAAVNPLQGLLNAIAYGNACQSVRDSYVQIKAKLTASFSHQASFSGEHIEVDFREGRGSVWTTQRKRVLSC